MTDSRIDGTPSPRVERIVILCGGFAGVCTAQDLVRRLRRSGRVAVSPERDSSAIPSDGRDSDSRRPVSVTLFSRDNYFVFQPLLADVVEINMRRTRTRPGEAVREVSGEPASVGVRADAAEELVI
jgi:NADH dehydrogenase FAD-containing subunit